MTEREAVRELSAHGLGAEFCGALAEVLAEEDWTEADLAELLEGIDDEDF